MKVFVFALLGLLVSCSALAADAPSLTVDNFFDYPEISEVKISPDGKYLAMAVADDQSGMDRNVLAIVGADDKKPTAAFKLVGQQSIYNFWWVNNERVIVATQIQTGSFDGPLRDGNLYAINVDGTKKKTLMGPDAVPSIQGSGSAIISAPDNFTHLKRETTLRYFKRVIAVPADFSGHVLVGLFVEHDAPDEVYDLDTYNGFLKLAARSATADGDMLADNAGAIRLATGQNTRTGYAELNYRAREGADWKSFSDMYNGDDPGYTPAGPAGFTGDDKRIYWFGRTASKTLGLFTFDPDTGKRESLFGDPSDDIAYDPFFDDYGHDGSGLIWSFDYAPGHHVIAVETMPGLPAVHIIDPDDPKADILAKLFDAFPGQHVEITSNSRDHNRMIVYVTSDQNPGDFYLFDLKANKAQLLYSSKSDITPDEMASMQPVSFTARDGLTLHGYLTAPKGVPAKNLPLILVVHGGPHGIRDRWGWDPETQFFAYHGYAVLQVNYRGSAGYGMNFQDMGYRHWGTTMQDDLADAVRWAAKQGIADPKRVCIYGASYGGYAAFENPIRYPDLYKCAVGYVGAYDLTLLGHAGAAQHDVAARTVYDIYLGSDMDARRQASPVFNADKLGVPLLLIYGGADENVVPAHAEHMMSALDKIGKKYTKVYFANEGHGFRGEDHMVEAYDAMLKFFDQYIGPGAGKASATTLGSP